MASEGKFIPLAEAAAMKEGLRCTGVPGLPGVWLVAIKSLYHVKQIPVIHVDHPAGDQEELFQLTSQKSNPVTWWADEHPRSAWLEQVMLAERVGSGPTIIPEDPAIRAEVIGLCDTALGSPGGLCFEKRNLMMSAGPFAKKYYWSEDMKSKAPARVAAILNFVDGILQKQKAKGSKFLVGDSLTAADVCWACALIIVAPPPEDIMPRYESAKGLVSAFETNPPEVSAAISPLLLEHQCYILQEFCDLAGLLAGRTNTY
mmetsp:Transcript_18897/g.43921  ORF Transcript_18897/g.43921 Transcript_18897/m.43921 type:complete len:259 (-) Transcript_18897:106-882(-)